MEIQTTKMSSRGQVVIPQRVREIVQADEGTLFTIMGSKDTIVLKKIKAHSRESLIRDLENMATEGRKRAEKLGIKEKDISEIIHKVRKEKKK